jgi:hypothetical protein
METKKLSLKSVKNVLSRGEMKKIMAGSGGVTCCCSAWVGATQRVLDGSGINCYDFCVSVGFQTGCTLGSPACAC